MMLLELFREAGEGKASSLLPGLSGLSLSRSKPFAWVPRWVYIGPPGTMVIQLGVGPSRLCLRSPASTPAAGARRLVGPAGCRLLGRQAGPTIQGLVGGWLLWLHLVDVSSIVANAATVPPPVRRSL